MNFTKPGNLNPESQKKEAVIAESGVAGNSNLEKIKADLVKGYKPQRMGSSIREFRQDHTAFIENDKPIYVWQKDENDINIGPRMIFGAGWYLSLEENHIKEEILKNPEHKKLNEEIWAKMTQLGKPVEKEAAAPQEVKIIG